MNLSLSQIKKIAYGMGIKAVDFGEEDFASYDPQDAPLQTVPEYNQQQQDVAQQQQEYEQSLYSPELMKGQIDDVIQMITQLDQTNAQQDQSITDQEVSLNQVVQYLQNLMSRVNKVEMENQAPQQQPSKWDQMKSKFPFGGKSK